MSSTAVDDITCCEELNNMDVVTSAATTESAQHEQKQQLASVKEQKQQQVQLVNEILRVLSESGKLLRCLQAVDGSVYVLLKPDTASPEQLMEHIHAVNNGKSPFKVVTNPGEVVSTEELLASIKTYANQSVRRDMACTQLGEEAASRIRRTMLDPLLELHRLFANTSSNLLSLYHMLHRATNPG